MQSRKISGLLRNVSTKRTFIKIIPTSTTGIVQTWGKFTKTLDPGVKLYLPIMQKISVVSNRLRQNNFEFEVKTSDNVFSTVEVSIQYEILPSNTTRAFFSLEDPKEQVKSYIDNAVRSHVSNMTLDQLFTSQNDISEIVNSTLSNIMEQYGYTIKNTLITRIDPSEGVKMSMNKIQEDKNLRQAAIQQAEAEYVLTVKQAEADKLRKKLQGEGIRDLRIAILDGFQEKISEMSNSFQLSPAEVISFVQNIQKLDTLESMGQSPNTKILFMDTNTSSNIQSVTSAIECANQPVLVKE